MNTPPQRVANFSGTPTITWSNGANFNGFAAIALVPPTVDGSSAQSWPKVTLGNVSPAQQLPPGFAMIPIQNGKLPTQLGLYFNADLNPPNTQYVAYYYDSALVGIAGPSSFFTVTANPVSLPAVVLPSPVTTGAVGPTPDVGCHGAGTGAGQLGNIVWSINETPSGTMNGVNVVFTLLYSPLPGKLSLYFNGSLLTEGSHYTLVDNQITFLVPFIPQSGDNIRATYPYAADPNTPPFFTLGDRVVINETPAGTMDGSNVTFTLLHTPNSGTLNIFFNGSNLTQGVHYTLSGFTITFLAPFIPQPGDWIRADYIWHA